MTFAEKFKSERERLGYTQKGIAELLSVPKRTVENWETELRTPPEYVQKLVINELKRKDPLD